MKNVAIQPRFIGIHFNRIAQKNVRIIYQNSMLISQHVFSADHNNHFVFYMFLIMLVRKHLNNYKLISWIVFEIIARNHLLSGFYNYFVYFFPPMFTIFWRMRGKLKQKLYHGNKFIVSWKSDVGCSHWLLPV